MTAIELDLALSEAAAHVLETMFFTSLAEDGEPTPITGPCICTRVSFHGGAAGRLGVRVPFETAREIAANFLGVEGGELTEARVDDVICELTNMICGLVLGRLDGLFELSHPEVGPRETRCPRAEQAVCRTLALEGGAIEVWLEWEAG